MNAINLEFATKTGENMAAELNKRPSDAQNWSPLGPCDEIPEFDYVELRTFYGCVTDEIERAYKAGFNAVFVPVNGDDE